MAFVCTKPRPEAGKKVFLKEVANGYWEKHSLVTLTRYINDPRDPVWEAKDVAEREPLSQKAGIWATRQHGHRVTCPACASQALVMGTAISAPVKRLEDDLIIEVQDHLPTKFECVACNLKIAGLSTSEFEAREGSQIGCPLSLSDKRLLSKIILIECN